MIIAFVCYSLVFVTVPAYVNEQFEKKKFEYDHTSDETESESKRVLSYRLLTPDPVRQGQTYPLIVWLSGLGATNNKDQLQYIHETFLMRLKSADCPYYIFAPELTDAIYSDFEFEENGNEKGGLESHPSLHRESIELIDACIHELLDEHAVDTERVYLISLGAGGRIAWGHFAMNSELYAAYLGFNTPLNAASKRVSLKNVPAWFFFSFWDDAEHVKSAKRIVERITEDGGKAAVNYADFTDDPFSSVDMAFEQYELLDWLFSQSRSAKLAPPPGQGLLLQMQKLEFWRSRSYTLGGILVLVVVALGLFRKFRKRWDEPSSSTPLAEETNNGL